MELAQGAHKRPSTFTVPKDASISAGVRSKVSERASSEQEVVNQPAAPKEGLDVDMSRILNQLEATMRQIVWDCFKEMIGKQNRPQ